MRIPRMSGNAWVCTIIGIILLASGAEQLYYAIRGVHQKVVAVPPPPPAPKIGEQAPDFTLAYGKGGHVSLAQFRGKPMILNFFCGCGRCKEFAKHIAGWQKKNHVAMIGLVSFDTAKYPDFQQETHIAFPLIYDLDNKIRDRYQSSPCPRAWVLDAQGKVVYTNPPDPDPTTLGKTARMVRQAYLHPVIPKKPVAPSQPATQVART